MALGSVFGRRTDEEAQTRTVRSRRDRDDDYNFDDYRDAEVDRNRDGVDDRTQSGTIVSERHQTAPLATSTDTTERLPDDRTTTTTEPVPTPPPFGGRTSFMATLGLVLGVVATLTALTGQLAPVALVVGVLGLLFSLGGVSASGRRAVNGRGVAMLGLLGCLAGIVLAVVAMSDTVPWLTSDTDQVGRVRDWLDAQFPFLKDW